MSYFDRQKKTEVIVDASPVGLGAILVQGNESEQKRVVAYASTTLTVVEQRYSQTEHEALAIVWSCDIFIYICTITNLLFFLTIRRKGLFLTILVQDCPLE